MCHFISALILIYGLKALWFALNHSLLLYFTVLLMMNIQICSCSAVLAMTNCLRSPKSPELFQPFALKYDHRSTGWELDTKSVGRPSDGKLLCPLPHCGVEITVGTCTDTHLKLQASIHPLQSEACRQQDWHDVPSPPTLEPWSHKLLLFSGLCGEQTSCLLSPTHTNEHN